MQNVYANIYVCVACVLYGAGTLVPAFGTLLHRSPVERALMTLQEIAKGLRRAELELVATSTYAELASELDRARADAKARARAKALP